MWVILIFLSYKNRKSTSTFKSEYFIAMFLTYVLAAILYSLYSGTKKISSNFEMSDVNFLCVSPVKPQTILLYGIIKKLSAEIFAMFCIMIQIPYYIKNSNAPILNVIFLILSFIIFQAFFCNILKLFIFALNTKIKKLGEIIRSIVMLFLGLIFVFFVFVFIKGKIFETINSLIKVLVYNKYIAYIPVFGWMREIVYQTLKGINFYFYVYIFLFAFISFIMLYIVYNLNLDYYEDILTGAEQLTSVRNIRENKEKYTNNNIFTKPFRKRELKLNNIYGAKVLFYKQLNEYIKRSPIFFINIYSIILFLTSILLGIFAKGTDIKLIFLVSTGLLFFSAGMAGKIFTEINYPLIFMLPDTPQRKLLYGSASSIVKSFSDSILIFVPFGILSGKSILEILICIICYVLLSAMLSFSGIFAFRISRFFGFEGVMTQSMFFVFFQILLMAILLIFVLVKMLVFKDFNGYSIYLVYILYSLILSVLFFKGSIGIFKDTEF